MTIGRFSAVLAMRPVRAVCLMGALCLVAACGADGEPETPTRGDAVPTEWTLR